MADVGYRLKVEGEAQFNEALKEITNNVKLNKAEIALLTEEYNTNGGSVDTLAQKSEQLDKAVENQREKVSAMKAMYEQASQTIEETDPRMVKLATDIAKQETELVKLTAAQKENESALKATSSGVDAYDESIGSLDRMLAQSQAELAKLDQQMKTTSDSTAKSGEAASGAAKSQEDLAKRAEQLALTAEQTAKKQEIMTQAVETQKAKVGELQKALEASKSAYGDSSKEVSNYQLMLTKAETELDKMEKSLGETSEAARQAGEAAKQAGQAMDGIGDGLPEATSNAEALGGVFGDIGNKVGGILDQIGVQLPAGITDVIGQFGAMAGAAGAVVSAVANIVTEMNNARDEAANYIDELNTTASIADLPTDVIQEWQYMSDSVDVSVDTILKALRKLKENMRDAEAAGQGFIEVGEGAVVPIYDMNGELRDLNDIFLDTLDGLKGIDNYLDRDAASMALFGKKANELNPLLDHSRQNIEAMRQEAHDYGYVTDEVANRVLSHYQDIKDQTDKAKEAYERNAAAYRAALLSDSGVTKEERGHIESDVYAAEKRYGELLLKSTNLWDKWNGVVALLDSTVNKALKNFVVYNGQMDRAESYAVGTAYAPAGLAVVGEQGTEIMRNYRAAVRSARPLAAALEAATGGRYTAVGENGPEITYMRGGERVYPHGVIPVELQKIGVTAAIRGYASGIESAPAGAAVTGERGTEIVRTSGGMEIPAAPTASSPVTNQYFDVRIDADRVKEFNDIVRIAESERRLRRMGFSGR